MVPVCPFVSYLDISYYFSKLDSDNGTSMHHYVLVSQLPLMKFHSRIFIILLYYIKIPVLLIINYSIIIRLLFKEKSPTAYDV